MEKETVRRLDALPGWLSVHEGQFLRKAALLVEKRPGEIVEIGSFQGKSTIWLASSGQHVFAVDPHKGDVDDKKMPPTLTAFKKHLQEFHMEKRVTLLQKASMEAVAAWRKPVKLLFIDGLHDEKHAGEDFREWSRFVAAGGIIAMHDAFCGWEGAQHVAFENIVENDAFSDIGVVGSIIYGIRGESTPASRLFRWRTRLAIRLSFRLHRSLSPSLSFFLIHRVLKALLLNRFTLQRE